jgi:tetratricopeptide (TPR) repeat protein
MSTATENNMVLENTKKFWETYNKKISIAGIVIIVLAGAWIGYKQYSQSQDQKANEVIFMAEDLFGKMANTGFNKDSVNIVLNGGDFNGYKVKGILKVISEYGSTPTADRARYMAGACSLHINEYDKAIKYLKEFDDHGASQIGNRAYLLIGHAYAEKKNVSEAMDYYKKSAEANEKDETFASDSWMTYARYAEVNGKTKEAIDAYKNLKSNFPTNSMVTSGEVDKHLARLGELN